MLSALERIALFDVFYRKLTLLRWLVRALIVVTLLSAMLTVGQPSGSVLAGFFFISLPFGIFLDLHRLFLSQEIAKEEPRAPMSYASALLLARSRKRSKHLWYYLTQEPSVRFFLARVGLSPQFVYDLMQNPPSYDVWITEAKQFARARSEQLRPKHLFEVLQELPQFLPIWERIGLGPIERSQVWQWYERMEQRANERQQGFIHALTFSGGVGRDWSSGYTHHLEAYAADITQMIQQAGASITLVGHDSERKKIIEYLSRSQTHNVVLVGEEGVGKERLTYVLASDFVKGSVPVVLKTKHIYRLETGRVVSGGSQEQIEARLHNILQEAATVGNVILLIPDLHLLIGAQGNKELGVINAASILASYLESSAIHIIGTTTPAYYYQFVKPNSALEPFFLPVDVKEIGPKEALEVAQDEAGRNEAKTGKFFTYQSLVKLVRIADLHIHDQPFPEKALQLLDEVSGAISDPTKRFILPQDVEAVISGKLKIPMGQVSATERTQLENLEQQIQSRIVGQSEAVTAVSNALRRARAGLHSGKRPIGTFLFLGPTGVGKTEMAKTIAAIYYKNEKAFIRLDMSEYQTPNSVEKIVGTRSQPGILTTAITDQPFSVVLLDEIEKSDAGVRNLFLQILDEGHVTDGYGKRVDFTNAMIIATSNAGAQLIRDAVEQQTQTELKPRLLDYIQDQGIFSPEWLNRFDSVVVFMPLTREQLVQIAKLQVASLVEHMKRNNINLTVADDVYDVLIEKGYDPQYGARPMRRAVQDVIESALAKVLIQDTSEGQKNITLTRAML